MARIGRPPQDTCRRCERSTDECGPLSARKRCRDCAVRPMLASIEAMMLHRGPIFEHWRARMAASVGATLPARDLEAEAEAQAEADEPE